MEWQSLRAELEQKRAKPPGAHLEAQKITDCPLLHFNKISIALALQNYLLPSFVWCH